MESERDDDNFREAFGEHTGISAECRGEINDIKDNDPDFVTIFAIEPDDADNFSNSAWELLGGYIANNDRLETMTLRRLGLNDSKMALLFQGLAEGSPLEELDLERNDFGIDGIRSMVPFLKNAQNLSKLGVSENGNINAECFRVLSEALHSGGGTIEALRLSQCNIDDIMTLGQYFLPRLRILDLERNNIRSIPSLENYTNLETLCLSNNTLGMEGCRSLSKLLQEDGSRLSDLYIASTDMGDEEAEVIANSLQYNTVLTALDLRGNNFGERGFVAFLKLVNDVSSFDSTYNSNHTLRHIFLPISTDATIQAMKHHIRSAIEINMSNEGDSHAAGRAKIINTQLNSDKRKELSRLQCNQCSDGSILAVIKPLLLPEVLALVGEKLGEDEFFQLLINTVPYLVSIVDRKAVVKQMIAENTAEIAALTAEYLRKTSALADKNTMLNQELTLIESAGQDKVSGKKRGRGA